MTTYAQARAALDKQAFLQALPGPAVFIRLDERGGEDEPAPWAFHGSGLPLPIDVPASDEDTFVDRTASGAGAHAIAPHAQDSTLTGPTFQLSIPAARGRATVHVVPHGAATAIGRAAVCGVRIRERSVSRAHAQLLVENPPHEGRTFCVACSETTRGGHNGVSVNGKRLLQGAQQRIGSGDVVELGDVSLLFLDAPELYDGLPRLMSG